MCIRDRYMGARSMEMGNPFRWVELTTDDLEQAKEFYSEIFNWKLEAFEESTLPYYFVKTGGDAQGGMMGKPSSRTPTAWTPYVEVKDLSSVWKKKKKKKNTLPLSFTNLTENTKNNKLKDNAREKIQDKPKKESDQK
eukprot:TRINITY_DN50817_c0_g1_i1.p2 TRINITY_DN50817_c0_g1~~TRINITY_DN50817_c0_g1_i1.p2  ORF type:complete len:138 (-),score=43.67 TRINITY_DN50817_c0_g1_i1:76-489(-)